MTSLQQTVTEITLKYRQYRVEKLKKGEKVNVPHLTVTARKQQTSKLQN